MAKRLRGRSIETDYLVVGAGAMGMAFTDALVAESAARVVMVDRHHRPGGHWNDAYAFVRLHQSSACYGVSSLPLGRDTKDAGGLNAGLYELASGAEVCGYFDQVMQQRLLPTGRVEYFPRCEYRGNGRLVSLVSGAEYTVTARKAVVDATYTNTELPSTRKPSYSLAEGVRCVPPNELVRLDAPPAKYVVVGAGKTGIDVCLWLLESGVPPEDVRWIKPREAWLNDRSRFQPGDLVGSTLEGLVLQLEAAAGAETTNELFARLEAAGVLLRVDEEVTPTAYRCATVTRQELAELRRIRDVVRLGRVRRIERDAVVLDGGTVPAEPGSLYVDCSASGISKREPVPVFAPGAITLQSVRVCQPCFSAALTGHVEATYDDTARKNELCPPIPYAERDLDWLRMTVAGAMTESVWAQDRPLRAWIESTRLNVYRGMTRREGAEPGRIDLLERLRRSSFPAMMKLQQFLAGAAA